MTSQVPCPSSEPDQMIPNWKWLCWQCCWKNYKSIVNKQTDPQLIPVRCYWWRSLNGSSSIGNVGRRNVYQSANYYNNNLPVGDRREKWCPLPFLTPSSFLLFPSPQATSKLDRSFKFEARTRSFDQNFTKANFHGTKDWVCCWHCVSGRGRGGGRPFGGVLANEAKQEKTKVAHSASLQTDQNSHDHYFAVQHITELQLRRRCLKCLDL